MQTKNRRLKAGLYKGKSNPDEEALKESLLPERGIHKILKLTSTTNLWLLSFAEINLSITDREMTHLANDHTLQAKWANETQRLCDSFEFIFSCKLVK